MQQLGIVALRVRRTYPGQRAVGVGPDGLTIFKRDEGLGCATALIPVALVDVSDAIEVDGNSGFPVPAVLFALKAGELGHQTGVGGQTGVGHE